MSETERLGLLYFIGENNEVRYFIHFSIPFLCGHTLLPLPIAHCLVSTTNFEFSVITREKNKIHFLSK